MRVNVRVFIPLDAPLDIHTRYNQKVLGLMYFGLPRNKKLATIIQYNLPFISMHILHRCFSLLIPLKHSFTASMTHSLLPEFLPLGLFPAFGTDSSQKELNLENMRDEEGFRSRILLQQAWHLATCEQGALSRKNRTPGVNFPLLFLTISWRSCFFCIVCIVYHAIFLKTANHVYSLITPKDRGHHISCWRNSNNLGVGEPGYFPLHALPFRFRIKVMDPSLILGHNSVHKFLRDIFIARQETPIIIEAASLLIFR